jgi:hypothetical protein
MGESVTIRLLKKRRMARGAGRDAARSVPLNSRVHRGFQAARAGAQTIGGGMIEQWDGVDTGFPEMH